jgi:hypothetical protein
VFFASACKVPGAGFVIRIFSLLLATAWLAFAQTATINIRQAVVTRQEGWGAGEVAIRRKDADSGPNAKGSTGRANKRWLVTLAPDYEYERESKTAAGDRSQGGATGARSGASSRECGWGATPRCGADRPAHDSSHGAICEGLRTKERMALRSKAHPSVYHARVRPKATAHPSDRDSQRIDAEGLLVTGITRSANRAGILPA